MSIDRQNILELIGKRKNQYHSCILTTFSFDFHFFEWKVMKHLRICGVRNVNVLIDGHYYSQLMDHATGEEMQHTAGYSIYPVFHTTIFHPKIWLLFGEKEGLLVIGSGNLTHAGNGTNDEIWGAFHVDESNPGNSPLFATAWHYIQQFCGATQGLFKEKTTKWLFDNSKWLLTLPNPAPFQWVPLKNGQQVVWLHNDSDGGIWNRYVSLLGQETASEVIVVSPYFDQYGKVLSRLRATFPEAHIQVVMDERGSIPHKFIPDDKFSFFPWSEVGVTKYVFSRLHAKLIYVKTISSTEYCLFGSANMTVEGMGLSGISQANHEVSLVVRSAGNKLSARLGLTLDIGKRKSLSSFKINTQKPPMEEVLHSTKFRIRLLSVELLYESLTFYYEGNWEDEFQVELTDGNTNRIALVTDYVPDKNKALQISDSKGLRYVQIWSGDTCVPVSNKLLIAQYETIAKTNPDPFLAQFEAINQEIQESGELGRVLELLHYVTQDWEKKETYAHGCGEAPKVVGDAKEEKLYNLDEFIELAPRSSSIHTTLLSTPSLRILELFQNISFIAGDYFGTIQEDEQVEDVAILVGDSQDKPDSKKVNSSLKELRSEQYKLRNYLKRLAGEYRTRLDVINMADKVKPLTLNDVAKYLIALELIKNYGGRTATYQEIEGRFSVFQYLPYSEDNLDMTHIKGCCLTLIGGFLALAQGGFLNSNSTVIQKKMARCQREALVSTVVCILNTKWDRHESQYITLLLLNSFHCLGLQTSSDLRQKYPEVIKEILTEGQKLKNKCSDFSKNIAFLQNQLSATYSQAVNHREQKIFVTATRSGNLLYKYRLGYCSVYSIEKKADKLALVLSRPGFPWDKKKNEFISKGVLVSSFVEVKI